MSIKKILGSFTFAFILLFTFSLSTLASELEATELEALPVPVSATDESAPSLFDFISPLGTDLGGAAQLSIFASSSATGSASSETAGHAFITVANIQSPGNIIVGKLSGIGSYKTVSLGTWGNTGEHKGLYYNLESYFAASGSYSDRVSLSMTLTTSQLATINKLITNSDSWSITNNCTAFATKIWNSVSSVQLSNGITNTPSSLRNSIQSKSGYLTKASVPYNYYVYYANGTGTPIRSIMD